MNYKECLIESKGQSYDCAELRKVYDLISDKNTIDAMVKLADRNKTPLAAIVKDAESICGEGLLGNQSFRQIIGKMVSYVMAEHGYETIYRKSKAIPRGKSRYFSVGSSYRFNKELFERRQAYNKSLQSLF